MIALPLAIVVPRSLPLLASITFPFGAASVLVPLDAMLVPATCVILPVTAVTPRLAPAMIFPNATEPLAWVMPTFPPALTVPPLWLNELVTVKSPLLDSEPPVWVKLSTPTLPALLSAPPD